MFCSESVVKSKAFLVLSGDDLLSLFKVWVLFFVFNLFQCKRKTYTDQLIIESYSSYRGCTSRSPWAAQRRLHRGPRTRKHVHTATSPNAWRAHTAPRARCCRRTPPSSTSHLIKKKKKTFNPKKPTFNNTANSSSEVKLKSQECRHSTKGICKYRIKVFFAKVIKRDICT